MENQDKRNPKDYFEKYNITNDACGCLIAMAVFNNVDDEIIEEICSSTEDDAIVSARLLALTIGIDDYLSVSSISDIEKNIREKSVNDALEFFNKRFDRFDSLSTEIENMKAALEELKTSNAFSLNEDTNNTITSMNETVLKTVDEIVALKDNASENIGENTRKLSQCIDALLELTECNVLLLEEITSIRARLEEVSNYSPEKQLETISVKLLAEQDKLFRENMAKMESLLNNKTNNTTDKRSFWGKTKTEVIEENKTPVKKEEATVPKAKKQSPSKSAEYKEYEEVCERIRCSSQNNIFDIFDLIRTGVFNDEQVAIIEEGLDKKLQLVQILEYAKPENKASTMKQLLTFLVHENAKIKMNNEDKEEEKDA